MHNLELFVGYSFQARILLFLLPSLLFSKDLVEYIAAFA